MEHNYNCGVWKKRGEMELGVGETKIAHKLLVNFTPELREGYQSSVKKSKVQGADLQCK